jgi:hypothetical protein
MRYCECSFPAPHTTPGKCGRCLCWTDDGFDGAEAACGYCGLTPSAECPVMGVPCDPAGRMAFVAEPNRQEDR